MSTGMPRNKPNGDPWEGIYRSGVESGTEGRTGGGGESHEIGQHSPEKEEGPEGFPFGPCFYQVD